MEQKLISVTLTPEQWDGVIGLIDIAVKDKGLAVASTAALYHHKIIEAARASKLRVVDGKAEEANAN